MFFKFYQEDEAEENKIKMQMVEKNMEQQKENMENLKSLKIEAENKYDTIKLKINQLSELADPLKVSVQFFLFYYSLFITNKLRDPHGLVVNININFWIKPVIIKYSALDFRKMISWIKTFVFQKQQR